MIKLRKPITIDDKKIEEIDLSKLEDLTGADIDMCAREAAHAKGEAVRVLVCDLEFHAHLAARASGLPLSTLKKLSAGDYVEVVTTVQAFLSGSTT